MMGGGGGGALVTRSRFVMVTGVFPSWTINNTHVPNSKRIV